MAEGIGFIIAGLLYIFAVVPLSLVVVLGVFGLHITYLTALAFIILASYVVGLFKGQSTLSIKQKEE